MTCAGTGTCAWRTWCVCAATCAGTSRGALLPRIRSLAFARFFFGGGPRSPWVGFQGSPLKRPLFPWVLFRSFASICLRIGCYFPLLVRKGIDFTTGKFVNVWLRQMDVFEVPFDRCMEAAPGGWGQEGGSRDECGVT